MHEVSIFSVARQRTRPLGFLLVAVVISLLAVLLVHFRDSSENPRPAPTSMHIAVSALASVSAESWIAMPALASCCTDAHISLVKTPVAATLLSGSAAACGATAASFFGSEISDLRRDHCARSFADVSFGSVVVLGLAVRSMFTGSTSMFVSRWGIIRTSFAVLLPFATDRQRNGPPPLRQFLGESAWSFNVATGELFVDVQISQ